MTTSGSYDFSMTRDEIIIAAFRLLGMRKSQEPTPDERTQAGIFLNMMLRSWQSERLGLWLQREITLFPADETASYSIGPSGTNCTATPIGTTLSAAAISGATTLTVTSITSITASAYIGIELDDGTRQWTTVSGTPSGSTVTLAAALTGAAASGNTVKVYVTKVQRPQTINEARWKDEDESETPLDVVDRSDYLAMTDKTTAGTPNIVYFDPQLTNGVLYVWPAPNDVSGTIVMSAAYPIQDMDAADNTLEVPGEWLLAVTYGLAAILAPQYSENVPTSVLNLIVNQAQRAKTIASLGDTERSVRLVPDTGG